MQERHASLIAAACHAEAVPCRALALRTIRVAGHAVAVARPACRAAVLAARRMTARHATAHRVTAHRVTGYHGAHPGGCHRAAHHAAHHAAPSCRPSCGRSSCRPSCGLPCGAPSYGRPCGGGPSCSCGGSSARQRWHTSRFAKFTFAHAGHFQAPSTPSTGLPPPPPPLLLAERIPACESEPNSAEMCRKLQSGPFWQLPRIQNMQDRELRGLCTAVGGGCAPSPRRACGSAACEPGGHEDQCSSHGPGRGSPYEPAEYDRGSA